MIEKATLIGAGNVAHHLGPALCAAGVKIVQVFSRNIQKARDLARITSSEAISALEEAKPADLVILAVSDQAIPEISAALSRFLPEETLVVHTSGATPSAFIAGHFRRYGVFYPLQTFSIGREVSFEEIPVCIHSGSEADLLELEELAGRVSRSVHRINDEQRRWLHLTAVVVNNFPNHLYALAYDALASQHLSFDLLKPLILETARKVQDHPPAAMQTGPARRGDRATIEAHLRLLEQYPGLREVYEALTKSLMES